MKLNQRNASFLLFLSPLIWGITFSEQSIVSGVLPPFSFNYIRMFIGFLVLLPFLVVSIKKNGMIYLKKLLKAGALCGIVLTAATSLQQIGIETTTAGKAGFVTSLYVLFVPVISLFMGKKVSFVTWICILIAMMGAYLLCINGDGGVAIGDLYVFLCAVFFALHIITIDRVGVDFSGVDLSAIQFLCSSVLQFVLAKICQESYTIKEVQSVWFSVIFSGFFSCGMAYTIQTIGQKYVPPIKSVFILSLESAIAALGGAVILSERMNFKQITGCVLVFSSVLFSQLKTKKSVK